MNIAEALPHIFQRPYSVVERDGPLVIAASLLRFHDVDAIPISFEKDNSNRHLVVQSYYCLSKLLESGPSKYRAFLEEPCENVASQLASISSDKELKDLFTLFDYTRFGIAIVEEDNHISALVSLRDLLDLYRQGIISSSLSIAQVGSPIFSMPSNSTLREALTEMFKRRIRRIFVFDKKGVGPFRVITDRKIIGYIFSSSTLNRIDYEDPLDTNLSKLEAIEPMSLPGNTKLQDVAGTMARLKEECVVSEKKVITPWDIIMRPWIMKDLRVRSKLPPQRYPLVQ